MRNRIKNKIIRRFRFRKNNFCNQRKFFLFTVEQIFKIQIGKLCKILIRIKYIFK